MAIAAYTEIISVERALNYLRQDDTALPPLEMQEIESMINAAFLFLERYTSHIFKSKTFIQYCNGFGVIAVYNFPIISTIPEAVANTIKSSLRTIYPIGELTYVAGYPTVEEIPDDFIQAALQMIKVWYFEAEKQVNESMIPTSVKQVLDTYRRYI